MDKNILKNKIAHALIREKCKRSLYFFIKFFWQAMEGRPFKESPHIEYLAGEAQKVFQWVSDWDAQEEAEYTYDLLVNVAPGTTKSTVFSKFGPAYLWLLRPQARIIATSYSAEATKSFTIKLVRLLQSDLFLSYFPDLGLKIDNVKHQINTFNGDRFATSTRGTVTGLHGDVILVDDFDKPPLAPKDDMDDTKLLRGATLTEILAGHVWHDDVLSSRKTSEQLSRSIYVQQRVHLLDNSGHLLKKAQKGAINLKHIMLPAEIDNNIKPTATTYVKGKIINKEDLTYLYTDNLLDINRLPKDILEKKKRFVGSHIYSGQYLQIPRKDTGGLIKSNYFTTVSINEVPDNLVRFFYTDPSEGKKTSDNMATICWSLYESKIYIWEVMAGRYPLHEFIGYYDFVDGKRQYINKAYDKFVKKHKGNWQSKHFFEAKSSGTPYIQYMNNRTMYNAIPDQPKGSKMDRVKLSLGIIESGRVCIVKTGKPGLDNWINEFISECVDFTGDDGMPDDRVDVLTGAIKMTEIEGSIMMQEESKEVSYDDYVI